MPRLPRTGSLAGWPPALLRGRLRIRLRRVFFVFAVILMMALTVWTTAEAAMDFPSRWAGYLVLFCGLASAWSGLSLLRWKTNLAIVLLFFFAFGAIAGLPIILLAFSSD